MPPQSTNPTPALPPPLTGASPASFAHYTITTRFPAIARRVAHSQEWPPYIVDALEDLAASIPNERLEPLPAQASDRTEWERFLSPFSGADWLTPPWLIVEFYFYRRLLEATRYFDPNSVTFGRDPFLPDKTRALEQGITALRMPADWGEINQRLLAALWGNQIDLSMWSNDDNPHAPSQNALDHLLVDDRAVVLAQLENHPPRRIDIIADNAGTELLADLILIDSLIERYTHLTVVLHLKPHPTFVSDATPDDAHATLNALASHELPHLAWLGDRLVGYFDAGRLVFQTDAAWVQPFFLTELPESLNQILTDSDLVISKGDCNYRRLLGDRAWPYTTPFEEAVSTFPAPLLAIRTLKAEVAAGLTLKQTQLLARTDPQWLVNGKWGVIQSRTLRTSQK